MKIRQIITKKRLSIWAVYLFVFLFQLRYLKSLNTPWVYDDEIGYWGTAAFMAGKDWSGVLKYCQYYSFGYGLLLVPLFIISNTPLLMYKLAIIMNAILTLIAFGCSINILKLLVEEKKESFYICLALVSVFNANTLLQSQIAWSETLLITLMWVITYVFLKYTREDKYRQLVIIDLLTVYLYMVHQRMLGVVIAVLICLVLQFFTSRKSIAKKILLTIIIVASGIALAGIIKHFLQQELWLISEKSALIASKNTNDYGGQALKIRQIFSSPSVFGEFLLQTLGKVFYFGRSTFLLVYVLFFCWIEDIMRLLRKKKEINLAIIFSTFTCTSFIGLLAVTAVSMFNPGRNDGLIYGRYAEPITGLIILCGLMYLLEWKNRPKKIVLIPIIFFAIEVILGLLIKRRAWDIEQASFDLNTVSMGRYFVDNEIYMARFTIELFIILLILCSIILIQKYKYFIVVGATALGLLVAVKDSNTVFNDHILSWQEQKEYVIELSEKMIPESTKKIYYILGVDFNQNGNKNTLQFLFPNKKVVCITLTDKVNDPDALIFASAHDGQMKKIKKKYKIIEKNSELVVLKEK